MNHIVIDSMQVARFAHGCSGCTFLGRFEEYDLYFCDQNGAGPTAIARYGSDGPEYMSGLHFTHPALQEAQVRALRMVTA